MAAEIIPISGLRRLPRSQYECINERILAPRKAPDPPRVRKLVGPLEGWRIRAGDYRVLSQVDDDANTVTIVRVRHRREAYC